MLVTVLLQAVQLSYALLLHIINEVDVTPRVMMYFEVVVESYAGLGEFEPGNPTDKAIVSHMQISLLLLGSELSESV